jgi:endonuclease YncB( thermonuclease family)
VCHTALCLLISLAALAQPARADFTGRVVKVHNGDTITVLVDKKQVRVRLVDIDAPELGQAFGRNSRQSLAGMCAGKTADVEDTSKDRYGRTLGRVACAGIDASGEQVRQGMAWVFARYVRVGSPLYEMEAYARLRQIGLWANPLSTSV